MTDEERTQIEQLRAIAGQPAELEDRLFILWEYAGAIRERALALIVLQSTVDPDMSELATMVVKGHQLGMEIMQPIAADLGLTLPVEMSSIERASVEAAAALPVDQLELFFIRRQRAMHAWDLTVFHDYLDAARHEGLQHYIDVTRAPLREHAEMVNRVAAKYGIQDGFWSMESPI